MCFYCWFTEVLPERALLYASRRLSVFLPSWRPFTPYPVIWWTLFHNWPPMRKTLIVWYQSKSLWFLYSASLLREDGLPILLWDRSFRDRCGPGHPLTLKILFLKVYFPLRCSFSRCICLPCEALFLLYEVCGIPCEVCCPVWLCLLFLSKEVAPGTLHWSAIFNIAFLSLWT